MSLKSAAILGMFYALALVAVAYFCIVNGL